MIGPNLSEWAIRSRQLTIYLMIVAVLAGASAFVNLGRDEDPSFTIKTMLVAAVWPGATMDEQLAQVTERLERTIQETPGLDAVRSITRPGSTTIFVDLEGEWPPERVADSWYEVRKRVADIRHTLPQGVLGPFFNDEFGDVFGIIYGFTADGFSHRELLDYVERARSDLLHAVDGIAKIEFLGVQNEQIYIELSPERVAALGLDYGQVFGAVAAQNVVRPSGTIHTGLENVSLRVTGSFETEADVLDVSLSAGGRMIRLGDIADVRRGFQDPPAPLFHLNGQRAIGLAISMREGGDVLELGRDVRAAMARITAELPIGIEPFLVNDQPAVVDRSIGDFTTSLYQAVAIILAVSLLAIGLRAGAMVAVAIPVTLATVFLFMSLLGIDLQRVSLGALIIALALLVDDAMTTTDSMLRRLAAGDTLDQAASFTYRTLAAPMLTGTLITIAGFVPIGFAAGQGGEYLSSLFQVVALALLTSWLVAVLFTPIVGGVILKPPPPGSGDAPPGRILRTYAGLVGVAIRRPLITVATAAALFVVAVFGLQRVDPQFFPASDRYELIVDLQLPRSSSIFASERAVQRIEGWLSESEDVDFWSAYIGQNVIRFYLPLAIEPPAPHQSQIVVMATDLAARIRLETALEDFLVESFPEAVARVSPLEMGPPVGWPVQYRLSGPDIDVLRREALELAEVVAAHPGTKRVHFDWIEPARQLAVQVDQDQARRIGLTSQSLSNVLQTAVSGAPITQLRDDIYLINVVARAHDEDRVTLDTLATLQVPVPGGRTVALSTFATFGYEQEQPLVRRRDRMPTLTVLADVHGGTMPETVVADITGNIAGLDAALPEGYRIELGGTAETSETSRENVFVVVPLMIFLMLTLLMVQLQNFAKMGMVIALLPLGLIGVVLALLTFGRPLGFVAILGILALIGMIAKNAVILLVQIAEEEARGLAVREAVVTAATGRLRPIMLTALSTILGLLPIAPTLFWGPMAIAIMGGLLVATLLTLVLLPALYVLVYGGRDRPAAEEEAADAA